VIQAIDDIGKLDNTLIIYICSDNVTGPEAPAPWSACRIR